MVTRILFAFLLIVLTFSAQAPTQASVVKSAPNDMALGYDVYAGGMRALQASLAMNLSQENYEVELDAKTQGFIGKLFPWAGHYATLGSSEDGDLTPKEYKSTSVWKKDAKQTRLEYKNGAFKAKHVTKNGKKTTQTEIKDTLTKDTVDMLTGAIQLLQKTHDNHGCSGSVPVFDGKRRFNLVFKDQGTDTIRKSKYSVFHGKAIKCIIEVEPVLGFKEKDKKRGWMAVQNHTKERKKMPTIWLASLQDDGPFVPVRMEISSDYGGVVAHLSKTRLKTPVIKTSAKN